MPSPLHVVIVVSAVIVVASVTVAGFDLVARPGFRKLAVRNVVRRRTEALLVVVGSSLATAIIAASLIVGSSFSASIRDGARTRLGPVDETVTLGPRVDAAQVLASLRHRPVAGVDGVLTARRVTGALTSSDGGALRTVPRATVLAVDFDDARAFGGDRAATGFADLGPTPGPDQVVLGGDAAARLDVTVGDRVVIHLGGTSTSLEVRKIAPAMGLAGSADAFVAPTLLATVDSTMKTAGAETPVALLHVSNVGGVFAGATRSAPVSRELAARLATLSGGATATIDPVKADLLARAEAEGAGQRELFSGVGTFSILAGVLLLVNLFVMLAEERRRELGLARAVGLRRLQLVRVFTLEGVLYAVAASLTGGILGIGMGRLVTGRAASLVSSTDDAFTLRFVAPAGDLATAAVIGLGLSSVTVWVTSIRIARLDIVQALRDLTPPPDVRYRLGATGVALAAMGAGITIGVVGVARVVPIAAVVGPPIAALGALGILRPRYGRRFATGVASLFTLVWCAGVFTFDARIVDASGVGDFVVQGLVMVAAAVGLSTALDRVWSAVLMLLTRTGRGLAGRLGLAYPLERLFRTSMLIAMYALIVFTLTFLAVYGAISRRQTDRFVRAIGTGTDLIVDSNASAPVPVSHLDRAPGVAEVVPVARGTVTVGTASGPDTVTRTVSGIDASFGSRGTPELSGRAPGLVDDRAVFDRLLADPSTIVADEQLLVTSGLRSPDRLPVHVGDRLRITAPGSDRSRQVTVIGLIGPDFTDVGAFMARPALEEITDGRAPTTRALVTLSPGAPPGDVAADLESRFVADGLVARSPAEIVEEHLAVELGFFRLIQSYLSVGLIVGIAGMAVVMVRAARERRRQVGMLRTIGISTTTVRQAFLVEASFISLQGIATGIGLGLLVAYQMLTNSAALGGTRMPFVIPWADLLALAVIPFLASLAAALLPASQAAGVHPAEVLRLPD